MRMTYEKMMKSISVFGLVFSVMLCLYGWHKGIFTSQEKLQRCIAGCGLWGASVFTVFQAVQVVVPILPGGIGCLCGVLLFGPWRGFWYNYLGICIGSMLAFLIAKYCGKPILKCLFREKTIQRYEKLMSEQGHFTKWFAAAIFLPVAPDDFLCYLAGTTEMSFAKFAIIILLGKPAAIALYSAGLNILFTRVLSTIGGLAG